MVQLARAADTLPPQSDVSQCDQVRCTAPATLAYRWEWGQVGVCCALHATLLQQQSETLKRGVVIHPIAHAAPPPLLRDERVALTARALVLEEEVKALESTHEQQHRKCGDLQIQLNAAIVKGRELEAQFRDASEKLQRAEANASELSSENGRLLVELSRLRELEATVAERSEQDAHERGLDGGEPSTTVDGWQQPHRKSDQDG